MLSLSLNSLCGISLNATADKDQGTRQSQATHSQFPLWDFFECNLKAGSKAWPRSGMKFSALNSLCGISLNATDAVSAVFRGIGGENQRVLPLTPLLQQPL
jgi:hypothetical protein